MELELHRLPNGVRVALDPMPGLGTAALGVWQRVGARWEPAEHNGIAHLFEHMAFKGAGASRRASIRRSDGECRRRHERRHRLRAHLVLRRVVAEHAPFALDMIADILFAPHWAPDDLEKEKDVVAQERGEAFDAPDDRVFELHQAVLYPNQPLGRPILGEDETLKNVSVETLRAFAAAHMTPDRVVISIAGAFDRDAFLETAARRFGHLKNKPTPTHAAAFAAAGQASETRKLEQTHLVFSWPAPEMGAIKHLRRAPHVGDFRRRHVFAALPGSARNARARLRHRFLPRHLRGYWPPQRLCRLLGQERATVAEIVREQLAVMADHGPDRRGTAPR
jgi:predicted Zn-dependent peptidase